MLKDLLHVEWEENKRYDAGNSLRDTSGLISATAATCWLED